MELGNNSWSVTYGPLNADKLYPVKAVQSNASVGATCPFMLSQASGLDCTYKTGLYVQKTVDATDSVLTVMPYVGYYAPTEVQVTASGKVTGVSNMFPATIHIPTVAYTSAFLKEIATSDMQTVLFKEFLYDITIADKPGGSNVQTKLTYSAGRKRKLYILPFFHANATATDPRQSLISSAPNTTSLCKLTNFKVSLASVNTNDQPLAYTNSFYIESSLISQGKVNGNAFISDFISGQIKYSDYKGPYNTYVIDLEKAINETDDDVTCNIQLDFKIDMRPEARYDFLVLSEYQVACRIDRVNGMIVRSDDV